MRDGIDYRYRRLPLRLPSQRGGGLTIGRHGIAGISLALAREKLIDGKKVVAQGKYHALEKPREKRRRTAAKAFGEITGMRLAGARIADSTKVMRKSIIDRDILLAF